LSIQQAALEKNMILKDASAYNIQFLRGRPLLIDTLSFEQYTAGEPWIAYGQFCRHFMVPLVLASYIDPHLMKMSMMDVDGIAIDIAASMLPFKAKWNPGVLMHVFSQGQRPDASKAKKTKKKPTVSKLAIEAIVDNLQQTISDLKLPDSDVSHWESYYQSCTYSDKAMQAKAEVVRGYIQRTQPRLVFDVGANTGDLSRLASSLKINTIAMDMDTRCVEAAYRRSVADKDEYLLPLVIDAANPTPSLGWDLKERDSIVARGPADLVMALALIHHLCIANNVPLSYAQDFFARLGRWLIIEFVPKDDVQVQHMLSLRRDIFPDYNVSHFLDAFSEKFELIDRQPVPESGREIFLFRNRSWSDGAAG
jgi:hypothetical protein